MKIKIFDLDTAERVQDVFSNAHWISITDVDYPKAKISAENKLCLSFDDVTPYNVENSLIHPYYKEVFKKREPIFFSRKMAFDIIYFINSMKSFEDELCIHCFAGKSRSVAIGAVVNTVINTVPEFSRDGRHFKEFIEDYCHDTGLNYHVYNTLMTAFLDTGEIKRYEERR